MSSQLFPPEIIQDTTETLFVKRTVHSNLIYLVVVLAVVISIALLPFIHVQVSTQARGIIRTPDENNQLQTAVYERNIIIFSLQFHAKIQFRF